MMERLQKGYLNDAGVDIILDEPVAFPPHKMTVFDLHMKSLLTEEGEEAAVIVPRSSYAAKGLIICNCPIDLGYTGNIHAVVYNASDEVICCGVGESFCQFLILNS